METQQRPGGHWSAANPIPTVQKFIAMLNEKERERQKRIKEANEAEKQGQLQDDAETIPHRANLRQRSEGRKVTDPTTGRDVEIDDVNKHFLKAAKDPQVTYLVVIRKNELTSYEAVRTECESREAHCKSNTRSRRSPAYRVLQPAKTDPFQAKAEYKHNQDITAPPDPIAEGATSDVPIHGEKTNILFHPTPSVSYEPMFKVLVKRAAALCMGILVAITVAGRILGGNLMGLVLLAVCITSAVWLWMREVIRQGRDLEWRSEQLRGEIV
jgi:hypothetical protein